VSTFTSTTLIASGTSTFGILKSRQTQIFGVNPSRVSYPLTLVLRDPTLSNQSEPSSSTCPLANRRFTFLPSASKTLNDSGFGNSGYSLTQLHKNLVVRSFEVHDLVTLVQSKSTTPSCFDCSGFGSLKILCTCFYWSDFMQRLRSVDKCPSRSSTTLDSSTIRGSGISTFHPRLCLDLMNH
jgi:hypothetical protein